MYKEYLAKFWYSAKALENSKVFFSTPTGGIYGEVGVNTFRNAIGAHYLPHSSKYVAPPSIDIVRPWFETIRYEEVVPAKGTKRVFFLLGEVVFKAPKTSSKAKSVSQGTKLGAKSGHKKLSTSLKQPSVSDREATKGGSSKAPTSFKTSHSKKRKESSLVIDSNPSQPPVFTPVDTGMHKEEQQATGGPTSLGITSEARANPQLSSDMLASNLNKPIYSASFVVHSESASGCDALADSITKADPGLFAPSDFIPQQNGMNEGTKTIHMITYLQTNEEIKFRAIKLENLAKLVPNVKVDFKDLDSLEDDPIIVVDDSEEDVEEDKNEEIHSTTNDETEYILASTSPSPRSIQLQELKNQVLLLQSQKHTLETKKTKSLTAEFSKILSAHDFSSLLPTELKDFPSKFNKLTEEVKGLKQQVHELDLELPGDLKDIPSKLEDFTKAVASVQANLKTIDTLLGLLLNVTKALNKFTQVLDSALLKAGDQGVPSAGQADTMLAEEEKNTNQATIS
ncbi:hypothetical protein Tco_0727071 [Tanacetum coccineum]|uniref:Uncharacterized protein n=1 Tax=Tanacetum coccineum TaxID=301880 RepID=A0ABQ4YHZ8_9ASTR